MTKNPISAVAQANGLWLNGILFDEKLPLGRYEILLGQPSRTIAAGPPAPVGHRYNQVHLYDAEGIYFTEHHATRLIDSVNFVFDKSVSPFQIARSFDGTLMVGEQRFQSGMSESDLSSQLFSRDLPGEFSAKCGRCWVGVSTKCGRDFQGKRKNNRHVVLVSICI